MKKRITKLVRKKVIELGLRNWEVDVHFHAVPEKGYEDANAYCISRWEYLNADLHFNLSSLRALTPLRIEETVVHELVHLILAPLGGTGEPANELATTHLARALTRRFT